MSYGQRISSSIYKRSKAMTTKRKSFEPDVFITKSVELLMNTHIQRGSVFHWGEIEKTIKLTKYTGSWGTIISKYRKRLLQERCQVTWAEVGVGIRFLTHSESLTTPSDKRQMKMFRQAGKAIQEIASVGQSNISLAERRLQASQIERLVAERKALRASRKEILQTTQTLPRRNA